MTTGLDQLDAVVAQMAQNLEDHQQEKDTTGTHEDIPDMQAGDSIEGQRSGEVLWIN